MRLPFRRKTPRPSMDWFDTKSHAWKEAGLSAQLIVQAARRARREVFVLGLAMVAVLVVYSQRRHLVHADEPVRWGTVVALVVLGWAFARALGRAAGPVMFRRMDPATAGTVGFLLRLAAIAVTLVVALRIAGLEPGTLAVGGAFTAVVFGLAAQQTLGNLIAGMVLLSARPFRVGERVRLQGGGLGGTVEGVVASLGLLYTVLVRGEDRTMVPNSVVLEAAVSPLREPDSVDLRARLRADVLPSEVQALLESAVTVKLRSVPEISLEEVDGDEVVVRIAATPVLAADGAQLADEILAAVGTFTADGAVAGTDRAAGTEPAAGTDRAAAADGAEH